MKKIGHDGGPLISRRQSLVAAVAAGAFMNTAQAKSPPFDTRQLVREWARCWTAHDVEGFLALYTDDAVYEDAALRHKSTGRDELRNFFQHTIKTFPDFKMTVTNVVADAHFGSGEWVMSGTFLGESFGQAPTGKSFEVPGCCFVRLDGGRIRYHCDYWNEPTFAGQVAP